MNILITMLSTFFVSVSALASEPELKINAGGLTFFQTGVLEFPDGDRCHDRVVEPNRFSIPTIKSLWVGQGKFEPVILEITVPHNDFVNRFTCYENDGGHLGLFLGSSNNTLQSGIKYESVCAVHCGAIVFKTTKSFNITATVTLKGIHTDTDGVQRPLQTTQDLEIRHIE